MNNQKKTALITGSSGGIGASAAVLLAQDGYNVAVNCRTISKLSQCNKIAEKCREYGAECKCFVADVSVYEECTALVNSVAENFGTVDVLVNNAGTTIMSSMIQTKCEDYDKIINQNQKSVFYMMQLCGRIMCKQKYGRIINLSSYTGIYGGIGVFAYSAAKGAVAAMTKSASKELAPYNITVNSIAPGMILTDMLTGYSDEQKKRFEKQKEFFIKNVYAKRLGLPEEVASAIKYLASEEAGYITGQVIEISGGILK